MTHNHAWRKSSFSATNNACVELAMTTETNGVRDSKRLAAGSLWFPHSTFHTFVGLLKST